MSPQVQVMKCLILHYSFTERLMKNKIIFARDDAMKYYSWYQKKYIGDLLLILIVVTKVNWTSFLNIAI